ncbi:MAG: SDR family NAD(P)-dependent oxidoreductase [Betaproteobacteria bacterium]|nr:MAG: SDR family NAD(P)-dependent oxidoreductase [Betaproteobacteria bacterium]
MSSEKRSIPVWFVTGCSTGLGRALAQRVLEHGHRAVVTARNIEQISDIVADYAETALAIGLDVNDHAQVDAAIAQAGEKFGAIDVLVNNAGYGYLAAVEEGDDRDVRDMFETNFYSLVALIRKVLPGMRAQGSGHIINISSVGGLVGAPSSGFYNATKFAVEGLTEALAKEVEPLGIRVTAIEPGPFRTDWAGRSLKQAKNPIAAYADTAAARRAQITGYSGKQPGDPLRAADAIIKVVESDDPPHNLILGKNGLDRVRAKLAALMQSIDDWEDVTLSTDYPNA